jgi:hypothetical protein
MIDAMNRISAKEARHYLERWRMVAEAEERELQTTSIDVKLRQLEALFASADYFPESADDRRAGCEEVSQRWARIRKAFGV